MQVHLEHLFHFRCDRDPNHYWSVADKQPSIGQTVYCPHCGHANQIEDIEPHLSPDQARTMESSDRNVESVEKIFNLLWKGKGVIEELRLWLVSKYPDPTNAAPDYLKPRSLYSALDRWYNDALEDANEILAKAYDRDRPSS